jgi:hypothetical protein
VGVHLVHLGIGDTGFGSGILVGKERDDSSPRSTILDFLLGSLDGVLGSLDVVFSHPVAFAVGIGLVSVSDRSFRVGGRGLTACSVMSTTTRESDRR